VKQAIYKGVSRNAQLN